MKPLERAGNVRIGECLLGGETVPLCLDCGAVVGDQGVHERFHSILASHGWTLAVLQTAHIAAHVHDRYETHDKIRSKTFDNWSADALAEVTAAPACPTSPDGHPHGCRCQS